MFWALAITRTLHWSGKGLGGTHKPLKGNMPCICSLLFERGFFVFSTAHDEYSLHLPNGGFWSIGWVLSGGGPFLCYLFSPCKRPGWLEFDSKTILTQRKGTMKWHLNWRNWRTDQCTLTVTQSKRTYKFTICSDCRQERKSWPRPGGCEIFSGTTESTRWETWTPSPKWRMIHNSFFKMKTPQMDGLPFYTPFQDMVLLKRSEQASFFEFDLVIWSKPSSTLCSIYWLCHGHSCIQSLSFLKYTKYIDTLYWKTARLCCRLHSIIHSLIHHPTHQRRPLSTPK